MWIESNEVGDCTGKPDEAVTPEAVKEAEEIVETESARVAKEVFEDGVASPELMFKNPLSAEDVSKIGKALTEGNIAEAGEVAAFNMDRINWANIENPEQIKALYKGFEDAAKPMIDEATGGVQSFEMTKAIADDLGYSTAQATELYKKTRGEGGLSAKMFATHQAVLGSTQHLRKLAKIAQEGGTDQDWFNLHRHVELHAGLLAMAKGSQTEIARALGSMRMMKNAMEESFHVFDDIASQVGRHKKGRDHRMADVLASARVLTAANDLEGTLSGNRYGAALFEMGINGLLSSPKTHIVNFTSNAAMSVIGPVERIVAAGFRTAAGDKHAIREAGAALYAQVASLGDAVRYATKALVEGKPVTDQRQRLEFMARRAIHSERDDALGIGIRTLGEVIRIPGRVLLAGDELFKTINNRAETAAQAYRVAADLADIKGIPAKKRPDWIKKEMQRIVDDPEHSARIKAAAVDYARFSTFQETGLTEAGRNFGTALNSSPFIKFTLAPFYRTPMNLLRQAFVDRTPMALMLNHWRGQLKKGGPDAALVYSRMTVGTGIFVGAYQMAEEGLITGKRDEFGNTIYLDGKPDYGMQIGDKWYSFNRLDPLGSMLSMAADFNATVRRVYDPGNEETQNKLLEMGSGITAAFMANALNKTWMKSLDSLMEFFKRAADSGAGTETRQRAIDKYLSTEAVKYVPFSSAIRSYNQAQDPIQREAWEFHERVQRSLGFSFKTGPDPELPALRDALGRPVERPEDFWYNPFQPNPESDNIVDIELCCEWWIIASFIGIPY